jgi:HSP20 family protein
MLTLNRIAQLAAPEQWLGGIEGVIDDFFTSFHAGLFPALNLWEDEKNLYAEAELPGVAKENLELSVHGHELRLRGERKGGREDGSTCHLLERGAGTFERVLQLPVAVDAEKIQAELNAGILKITMPKAQTPRRIEVKAN